MTAQRTQLETWKAVAAFFGKDERTVKRWEAARGLPIHRLPGARSRIYADVAELRAWRANAPPVSPDASAPTTAPTPPVNSGPFALSWAPFASPRSAAGPLAALAMGAAMVMAVATAPVIRASAHRPSAGAEALYARGMADFTARSPLSLNRAITEFEGALTQDSVYAPAYAGLADTYDLLREYTDMPASQAFPLAKAAAQRALALQPNLADAHAALAFADYWGFWDARAARAHFARAVALDPRAPRAHHWFATFLLNTGDTAGALREIEAARRLDPTACAIAADRALILHRAGRSAEALAILRALAVSRPEFRSPHLYLADIAFDLGDDATYLNESARAASLSGAQTQAEAQAVGDARAALAAGGHRAMLQSLLRSQTRAFIAGRASAFSVARLHAALGEAGPAAGYLRLAFDRREGECLTMTADSAFAPVRALPVFAALEARLGRA
jgi:Tfp pilus assembly protein PilF